jgi:hypothetical protein
MPEIDPWRPALRISICDLNPLFVAEAHHPLMELPNVVEVAHRSILDRPVDAVVSPANSFGFMDGGVDWAYLQFFGMELQTRVQMVIRLQKFQELLVGSAVVVPTYHESIRLMSCSQPGQRCGVQRGISDSITSPSPAWAPAAGRCGLISPCAL